MGSHAPKAAGRVARLALPGAVLVLLTVAAFSRVGSNGFVFDDRLLLFDAGGLSSTFGLEALRRAFAGVALGNWHPVTTLSHVADLRLWGADPAGHHWVSVAWHAACALTLFVALEALTGARWQALAVAALFAVHPQRLESVAWISERKDVLSGFFFALTLLLWVRHLRRPSRGRYGAALAAYATGLASKPMLVTVPFVLLLLDFWPLGRLRRAAPGRLALEKAPFFALALAVSAATLLVQRRLGATAALGEHAPWVPAANAILSAGRYLVHAAWPVRLSIFYPHPGDAIDPAAVGLSAAFVAAATFAAWRRRRRSPWLIAGWLWYLGMLVPVSGIVQVGYQAMADRYTYLPIVGILVIAVRSLSGLGARRGIGRITPAVAASVVVVLLAGSTWRQSVHWRDNYTVFSRATAVTRDNWLAQYYLGVASLERSDFVGAARHLREAVRLWPALPDGRFRLGWALAELGDHAAAVEAYRAELERTPTHPWADFGIAQSLIRLGRPDEAVPHLRRAAALQPSHPEVWEVLGETLAETGDPAGAREALRRARSLRGG